jgi:hypothetical protein
MPKLPYGVLMFSAPGVLLRPRETTPLGVFMRSVPPVTRESVICWPATTTSIGFAGAAVVDVVEVVDVVVDEVVDVDVVVPFPTAMCTEEYGAFGASVVLVVVVVVGVGVVLVVVVVVVGAVVRKDSKMLAITG